MYYVRLHMYHVYCIYFNSIQCNAKALTAPLHSLIHWQMKSKTGKNQENKCDTSTTISQHYVCYVRLDYGWYEMYQIV